MRVIIDEYGSFMISGIAFVGLMVMLTLFQSKFKAVSVEFIQNVTGVEAQYNTDIESIIAGW